MKIGKHLAFGAVVVMLSFVAVIPFSNVSAATKSPRGKIVVKAYYNKCKTSKKQFTGAVYNANTERWQGCSGRPGSKADLYVYSLTDGAKCNNKTVVTNASNLDSVNFGKIRSLKCTPGEYHLALANGASIQHTCSGDICTALDNATVTVTKDARIPIKLGTSASR